MRRRNGVSPSENSPDARLAASLADAQAGRLTRHASAQALMEHLEGEQETVGWIPLTGNKRPEAVTRPASPSLRQWNIEKLGKLTTKVGSGSTPRGGKDAYHASGVPLIRSLNVHLDGFRRDGLAYLDDEQANALKAVEVRGGDVLLNITGASIGRVTMAPAAMDGARVNQHVCIIRPSEALDPSFLRWYLASPQIQNFILDVQSGATRQALTKEKILNFDVPVPPLDQQKRIVAEIEKQFSRLDEAVANLKRVKANLKRYKAAVLKAAVEGRLVETEAELVRKRTPSPLAGEGGGEGASYETGAQLLQRILEIRRSQWFIPGRGQGKGKYKEPAAPNTTDLPKLPEGWVWATVESLSMKVADGVHKKPNYLPEGIPFVTVKNMTAGSGISFDDLNYVSTEDHEEFCRRTHPERGDILISKDGTLGVVRLVETDRPFSVFVSVALVKPVYYNMSRYLVTAFESPTVQRQMVPKGSGLQHIHLEDLRADCIPVPPLAEQYRIVAEVDRRLSLMRKTEAQVDANLQRAARLRQSILSGAFTSPRCESILL